MPTRFDYRSSDALKMLNSLLASNRQERQSDKEMALSALTFNIKREEGNKDRALNQLNVMQERVISLRKEADMMKQTVGTMGGTLKEVESMGSGIGTDASKIIYQSMSKAANDYSELTNLIKQTEKEYNKTQEEIQSYNASIRDYHTGLGRAAAQVFREYGDDGKIDEGEYTQALNKLKSDEKFAGNISDWGSFETGFNKGLQELTVQARKTGTERGGPQTPKSEKMLEDYNKIADDWDKFEKFRAGKPGVMYDGIQIGGEKPDSKAVKRKEQQFKRQIKLFEKRYPGQKIMEDFFPTEPEGINKSLSDMSVDELMEAYLGEKNASK